MQATLIQPVWRGTPSLPQAKATEAAMQDAFTALEHRRCQESEGTKPYWNATIKKMWQKGLLFLQIQFLELFLAYNSTRIQQ